MAPTYRPPGRYVAPPRPQRQASPMPFDARAENDKAAAQRNYDAGMASLQTQRQAIQQSYGFDDRSNPFSQAAMLENAYKNNRNATLNSYARSGQLYSGSLSNQRYTDAQNFGRSYDELTRNYEQALQSNQGEQTSLALQRDQAIGDANTAALERAAQTEVDPSTMFAGYLTRDPNKIRKRWVRAQSQRNSALSNLKDNRADMNRRGYRMRRRQINQSYRARAKGFNSRYNAAVQERNTTY